MRNDDEGLQINKENKWYLRRHVHKNMYTAIYKAIADLSTMSNKYKVFVQQKYINNFILPLACGESVAFDMLYMYFTKMIYIKIF